MSTGLETIFLRLAPADIAMVKFLFESYEGVAVVRTVDRLAAVIVVLVAADFRDVARGLLQDIRQWVSVEEIAPPPEAADDWLLRHLWDDDQQ